MDILIHVGGTIFSQQIHWESDFDFEIDIFEGERLLEERWNLE
jgi:hypothetical protein